MLKFLLVVVIIAVAVYLVARVLQGKGVPGPGTGGTTAPRRPLGPDDDPDFLWNLDKKKRHPDDTDGTDPPP